MGVDALAVLAAIYRYPVKGLSGQALDRVELAAGEGVPQDRRFAIAHGASQIDPASPAWHPKRQFLTLMEHERLAVLDTQFDDATDVLTIRRGGKIVVRCSIATALGRDILNQFFAAYMRREAPGAPKLVEAPGVMFGDRPDKLVSILSLPSIRDLERVVRRPVDPRRFRGNLLIDGCRPWEEFDWVGRTLLVRGDGADGPEAGGVRLRVVERIARCAATNVNPDTAERDLNIPKALMAGFGHAECGVYAEIIGGGTIALGDRLQPEP